MGVVMNGDYIFEFTLKQVRYRARVPKSLEHYVLERAVNDGQWFERVPCFTDAEEKRFPVAAGYVATAYLHGLRKETK